MKNIKYSEIFDSLKKGDIISISYGSSISSKNEVDLKVTSKNIVGKGKFQSEKITSWLLLLFAKRLC